jgi:hypothetical protein
VSPCYEIGEEKTRQSIDRSDRRAQFKRLRCG